MELQSRPILHTVTAAGFPLLLGGIAGLGCYWAAGPTLGLFLGSVAVAALLTPALICGESTWSAQAWAAAGLLHGIALVLLITLFTTDTTLRQWAECYVLLAAFVLAIAGVALILQRLHLSPVAAAALTTVLAIAWIVWPLWLAPALHGNTGQTIVSWLVEAHPLFAANSAVSFNLGVWYEQPVIYRLSNMNQDLLYSLPNTVWPAVVLHGGVGSALTFLCWRRGGLSP